MKKLLGILFSLLAFNCFGQDNLQYFSKALFIQLKSNVVSNYVAKDTIFIVPNDKAWNITNCSVNVTLEERALYGQKTWLCINDAIISYSEGEKVITGGAIWLPSGEYKVTIRTISKTSPNEGTLIYKAHITGIEYNVPR